MNKDLKQKISKGIEDYKRLFPKEYRHFTESQMPQTRDLQADDWARFTDEDGKVADRQSDYRALLEMPENCDLLIRKQFTNDDERSAYADKRIKRWIGKNYPEFLLSKEV